MGGEGPGGGGGNGFTKCPRKMLWDLSGAFQKHQAGLATYTLSGKQ